MAVQEIVTAKLKNVNITPSDMEMAIEEIKQVILQYCNIDDMPEGLTFTWANMSADLARYQYELTIEVDSNLNGVDTADVSSIKIGDTQINLQGGSSSNKRNKILKSHTPNLDQIVLNYKDQLNRYRRVVW